MKKSSMNFQMIFDIPEKMPRWKFHRLPGFVSLKLSPWLFVHGPVIDYVARWTKQDESCSFLSNFRDLLLTGYSSTTYIFQSTIQPSPLLFSTKKPDRFQLSPFLPPKKNSNPLSQFRQLGVHWHLSYTRCPQAWIWWSLAKQDNGSPQKC